ncbi:MAG TPA: nicotinate (nicotinamide) nucleotide adenylyltransferase [Rhizomicrobium sp.]|nr:nicotinate (nicotinamide) nucleotide adenylyltransferase [Rhizomicrobium sp.]
MTFLRPPGPVTPGLAIGLLGGSFNPAHEGHLYVAETAIKRLSLDYVWFLVSPQNPLKPEDGMLRFERRFEIAQAMAGRNRRLIVTDIERTIASRYTIDTIRALTGRFGGVRFVWLMGSDNLEQFHRWQHWQEIAATVDVAVVLRPGSTLAPLKAKARQRLDSRILIVDGHRSQASATAIRASQPVG